MTWVHVDEMWHRMLWTERVVVPAKMLLMYRSRVSRVSRVSRGGSGMSKRMVCIASHVMWLDTVAESAS